MAASAYETILAGVLERLKASGSGWISADKVKRSHRTTVTRDNAPQVHLVDGEDAPRKGSTQRDCNFRHGTFTVAIFVRSDLGPAAADPYKVEVTRRLSPYTAAYAAGLTIKPGRIAVDSEIADGDAIRIEMDFELSYPAAEWALS